MKRLLAALLVGLVVGLVVSWSTQGSTTALLSDWSSPHKVQEFRDSLASWGAAAPAVYVGLVVLQVLLAPLPGFLLYGPGGVLFGPALGGALALLGNMLGAILAYGIARWVGDSLWPARPERMDRYREKLEQHSLWIVFVLRLNPLTSSDLVSYAAGVARAPLWRVALGTVLGLAPNCFLQAYFAAELLGMFPQMLVPLAALALTCVAAALASLASTRR